MVESIGTSEELSVFFDGIKHDLERDGKTERKLTAVQFEPLVRAAVAEEVSKLRGNTTLGETELSISGTELGNMTARAELNINGAPALGDIHASAVIVNKDGDAGDLTIRDLKGQSRAKGLIKPPAAVVTQGLKFIIRGDALNEETKKYLAGKVGGDISLQLVPGEDEDHGFVQIGVVRSVLKAEPGVLETGQDDSKMAQQSGPEVDEEEHSEPAAIEERPEESTPSGKAPQNTEEVSTEDVVSKAEIEPETDDLEPQALLGSLLDKEAEVKTSGDKEPSPVGKDQLSEEIPPISEELIAKSEEEHPEPVVVEKRLEAETPSGETPPIINEIPVDDKKVEPVVTQKKSKKHDKRVEEPPSRGGSPAEGKTPIARREFRHVKDNLEDALENLKFENKRFSDPSISTSVRLGESKRERLKKMDKFANKAWEEFKGNSGEFRKKNRYEVVGTIRSGDKVVNVTFGDLENEINRFYPGGEYQAPTDDEDFKFNTDDKIRLLTVYNQFLKDKSTDPDGKTYPTSFTGTLFAELKKHQGDKETSSKVMTEDKSPEHRKEFFHSKRIFKETFEELSLESSRFSDPSTIRHTVFGESRRERLQKKDELAKKAWEEFKSKSPRFREHLKSEVVGKRYSGKEVVDVTLGDLEREINKFYPEGEYKAPATDEEFKSNAEDKVRLLSVYTRFISLKLAGKEDIKPVSFVNPLDKGTLFAEPKKHTVDSEGWPRDVNEEDETVETTKLSNTIPGLPVTESKGVKEQLADIVQEGPPIQEAGAKEEVKESEDKNKPVFHLKDKDIRKGAKAYRLLKVDYYKRPDYKELDKTVNLLFWRTRRETFVELVNEDGEKLEGTSTYKGPLKVQFKQEDENGELGSKRNRIWKFDAQVDYFANRFRAGLNTESNEFRVEIGQEEVGRNQPADEQDMIKKWSEIMKVNASELSTSDRQSMLERSYALFDELKKLRASRDLSPTDIESLDKLEKTVEGDREEKNLGLGMIKSILSQYGKTLGLKN